MIKTDIQSRILAAILADRARYASDAKHATALGISGSVYSAIKNGKTERQLSDAQWISIARRLDVSLTAGPEWKTARTATWLYVTRQLEFCQQNAQSGLLCDIPNIGKTWAARWYVQNHANAVWIDCSQVKSKQQLVRQIAKEFGLDAKGRYRNVYEDLVFLLRSTDTPLVILDEAGDLWYEAFLELKALWNATERTCAWYMMGADGLRAKIERSIEWKKVGFAELLSRYGERFCRVTPEDERERDSFLREQAATVARVNAPEGTDVQAIVLRSGGGLRRVYTEIAKSLAAS